MSFHQVQADMRRYVRRVYGAELLGSPVPVEGGVWDTWIRTPDGRKRNVRIRHADLHRVTSNDPGRKRPLTRKARGRHGRARIRKSQHRRDPERTRRPSPRKIRFDDLSEGDVFHFVSERGTYSKAARGRLSWQGARGPWVKVSATRYMALSSDGMRGTGDRNVHRVGTVTVKVKPTGRAMSRLWLRSGAQPSSRDPGRRRYPRLGRDPSKRRIVHGRAHHGPPGPSHPEPASETRVPYVLHWYSPEDHRQHQTPWTGPSNFQKAKREAEEHCDQSEAKRFIYLEKVHLGRRR